MDAPERGVVVLGMHRGGTSAVAGLLHLGGVPLPAPRHLIPPNTANPKGFWEITRLVRENDALLRTLGGEWSAPALGEGWESEPRIRRRATRAMKVFRSVMPRRGWLWKDPRLSLTLPFWRAAGVDVGAVFIVLRNPIEVSRSLSRRDRLSHPLGLALWEVYSRSAASVSSSYPTAVVDYAGLLADPVGWVREARDWMAGQGVACGEAAPEDALRSFVTPGLRRTVHTVDDVRADPAVSPQQIDLWAALTRSVGFHDRFVVDDLPGITPWSVALVEERRVWRAERSWRRARTLTARVVRGVRRRRRRRRYTAQTIEGNSAPREQLT